MRLLPVLLLLAACGQDSFQASGLEYRILDASYADCGERCVALTIDFEVTNGTGSSVCIPRYYLDEQVGVVATFMHSDGTATLGPAFHLVDRLDRSLRRQQIIESDDLETLRDGQTIQRRIVSNVEHLEHDPASVIVQPEFMRCDDGNFGDLQIAYAERDVAPERQHD